MIYYNIDISPERSNIITIITAFGEFRYNRVPPGLYASGDIFQSKVDDIFGNIEGVNIYINDILVLDKGSFFQRMNQKRIIFSTM